jgi:hypothetical protein
MSAINLPASILGGDPFNQFRFLYRRNLWWRLNDADYCLSVMQAAYQAGGRAFDLSFEENMQLFRQLQSETADTVIGFGNPTWEQGVMLNGRFLQYKRDRILRTLVERIWPQPLAEKVKNELAPEAVMLFGYDTEAELLSEEEIADIYLDKDILQGRLNTLGECRYMFFGGSDADWLVSLGRQDLLHEISAQVRAAGHIPILLCHYATHVVPACVDMDLDAAAYAIPFNKAWTWFDLPECIEIVQSLKAPVIAFMPLASGDLRKDVRASLDWLFGDMGVASILFGTATAAHAEETTRIALAAHQAAHTSKKSEEAHGAH